MVETVAKVVGGKTEKDAGPYTIWMPPNMSIHGRLLKLQGALGSCSKIRAIGSMIDNEQRSAIWQEPEGEQQKGPRQQ